MEAGTCIIKISAIVIMVCCLLAFRTQFYNQGSIYCTNRNGACEDKKVVKVCPEGTTDPCENGTHTAFVQTSGTVCTEIPAGTKFCTR